MTAKTAPITVDETSSTEAIRAALDEVGGQINGMTQRRADLLREMASPGNADKSAQTAAYIELGAQIDAGNLRLENLRRLLQPAMQREALADYERRIIDLHGLYSRAADLDQQITDARAALAALVEQRSKLEFEELQIARGRRSEAFDACFAQQIPASQLQEISALYKVPGYM